VKTRTEPSQVTEEPQSRPEEGLALARVPKQGGYRHYHVSVTR